MVGCLRSVVLLVTSRHFLLQLCDLLRHLENGLVLFKEILEKLIVLIDFFFLDMDAFLPFYHQFIVEGLYFFGVFAF